MDADADCSSERVGEVVKNDASYRKAEPNSW